MRCSSNRRAASISRSSCRGLPSIACAGTCLVISCRQARPATAVKDVTYAMAYADDMLADTIYNVEGELEREIEGEDPV
jgi:hypothetical protein